MPSIFDNIDDFEDGRPDFDDQDPKRQKQLIKNTVQLMSATTGIYVMRLSALEVKRIRHEYRSRACSRLDASQARAIKGRQRANTAAR